MMSETVVTVQDGSGNANNPRQVPKTDQGQATVLPGVTLNVQYFRSIPGIIKIVELVFGLICMICGSPAYYGPTHWFMFVAVTSFIMTTLWTLMYLFSLHETFKSLPINWLLTEFLNSAISSVFYLTAAAAQLGYFSGTTASSYIASGVFGLFNMVAYAAGTYFLYLEWKNRNTQ